MVDEFSHDLRPIRLPRWGRVAANPGVVPWIVLDEQGREVDPTPFRNPVDPPLRARHNPAGNRVDGELVWTCSRVPRAAPS
jgi:hypothetical protein